MRWTPHKYQEKSVAFLISNRNSGLLLDPGLGKTSISLEAFRILRNKGFVDAVLVIAPIRPMYTAWCNEVKKWDNFKGMSIGILHGPEKDEVLNQKHDIYLINPEGLRWFSSKIRTTKWKWDMLIVDESSKFKQIQTQRFKTLKPLLKKFKRRVILTGSPAPNSLLDLFGQMYVMDMGESFGPYITHYKNEFFFKTGYGGYTWALKPGAEDRIHATIAPRVLRMSAEDYLEMPELIIEDIVVELPPKALAIYKQLEDTLRLDFKEGRVLAANAAVASMKCRQVANGGIYLDPNNDEERGWQQIHEAKNEALEDLIEELEGQPSLIAYDFLHDLERIKHVVGKNTPHVGRGGMKPRDLPAFIERWNRGEERCLIGNPQSMAHGVDGLQGRGRAVIWYSLTWSAEDYDQFIRRIWRQGQKERVFVYRIVAKGTVDEAVLSALGRKKRGQDALFQALKDYWK